MIQIQYRGQETQYPLYETEEEAKQVLIKNGVDEDQLEETWPSPRGIENELQFVEGFVECESCEKQYDYNEEPAEVKQGGIHICQECWEVEE